MPDRLSAADIAEGRRLMQALADPRTGSEADAQMAVWLFGHLPALLDAAEKLNRVHAALANHPRVCDVHPDDDVISCGWKSAVAGVQWAINPEENR